MKTGLQREPFFRSALNHLSPSMSRRALCFTSAYSMSVMKYSVALEIADRLFSHATSCWNSRSDLACVAKKEFMISFSMGIASSQMTQSASVPITLGNLAGSDAHAEGNHE